MILCYFLSAIMMAQVGFFTNTLNVSVLFGATRHSKFSEYYESFDIELQSLESIWSNLNLLFGCKSCMFQISKKLTNSLYFSTQI